ncbi:MAG: bifunctional methylenetetrahydrofolate dehydrogenase/methenyltetrahydrofolate cyclohydrolase FolD [Acidobacteriota bacterium]|nr:bifunctional methylenetetrahydrofolate dehydrogenase/methenyltetrahydrofolate cyclohydrolase FolD [Acidobacteriota bacterium]
MGARVIDGRAVAALVRAEVADGVREHTIGSGRPPGLATILVGEDPASAVYVAGKQRACGEVGILAFDERLSGDASEDEVGELIERLNGSPAVSGILLQLPLPGHLQAAAMTAMIDPWKDVDGLTPLNAGRLALGMSGLRPCTPLGVMRLLAAERVALEGVEAVVIGRSNLFGKPMAALLLEANATVTVCHSRTRDLAAVCSRADLLVAAVGRALFVTREFVRPGATVIDVGVNRLTPEQAGNQSGLVGDVDFAAAVDVASLITPVPGGVGPMTIAMLLQNTLQAAREQARVESGAAR